MSLAIETSSDSTQTRREHFRSLVLRVPLSVWLFFSIWLLYGLCINSSNLTEFNLQQISVEAIVERGQSYVEGSRTPQLQPKADVFAYAGHLYAAKQPGQFLAGALVYSVLHALGLSYFADFSLTSALVTWLTAGFVTALAGVAIYQFSRALAAPNASRFAPIGAALAFALATIAFPYAGIAHHDALATGYLTLAFYLAFRLAQAPTRPRAAQYAALVGLLLGLTITTSMLPFLMVGVVALYFFFLRQWRSVPWFLGGAFIGLAPLLLYDTINFGNPLALPNIAGNYSDTFFHLDAKNLLSKLDFYARSLTLYVPLFWLGLFGLVLLPRVFRREQVAMLGMLALLGAYVLNIDTNGDCQFGPRYLLPAMPFAALGLIGLSYVSNRMLRLSLVVGAIAVAFFSFAVNVSGAMFGAMFCDLRLYAFAEYIHMAMAGKFRAFPLAPILAIGFVVSLVGLAVSLVPPEAETERWHSLSERWSKIATRIQFVVPYKPLLLAILVAATFLRVFRLWELPPGLWADEAFYGLDALRVLDRGYLAVFFAQNGGREPLFIYMQAAALGIWGRDPWVLRLVPVFCGIVTVALLYVLGKRLFAPEARARYVGTVAAAALAVSYWHVTFSRLGLRAILLPVASTLTIWLFWRGWQTGRKRDLILSGAALGVMLYTYLAARLLPPVLIAFVLGAIALAWLERRKHSNDSMSTLSARRALVALAIVLGVGLVVFLPLGAYFFEHTEDFLGRVGGVALSAENIAATSNEQDLSPERAVLENAVRVAGMFFVRGDENPRHNLPGRPALDWLTAFGFVVGCMVAILRLRRQPVYLLLLVWLLAMLAPSIFSTEAPHFLRTLGALPPIMILAADGLTRVWQRFAPHYSMNYVALLVLLFGGALTLHDYFQVWAATPAVYQEAFDVSYRFLADRIIRETANSDVLLPLRVYGRPALQFALASQFVRQEPLSSGTLGNAAPIIVTAQGSADKQWVVLHRGETGKGIVYFPHITGGFGQLRASPPQTIKGLNNASAGQMIRLTKRASTLLTPPSPSHRLDANFANELHLLGYDMDRTHVAADQTVELALYWQPLRDLDRDYSIFVHVVDNQSNIAAQWDSQPVFGFYTSGLWRRDAVITDLYPIHIPADTPPGEYRLEVGWLTGGDERLPVLDAQGKERDDTLAFGTLVVDAPSVSK